MHISKSTIAFSVDDAMYIFYVPKDEWKSQLASLDQDCTYYRIRSNYAAFARFKLEVHCRWHKWLNRRNRQSKLLWSQFNALPSPLSAFRPVFDQALLATAQRPLVLRNHIY